MPNLNISSETADTLFNAFNIALIVGAIIVAVATIGTIWTGKIRDRYSDLRISNNETEIARAGADAAHANQAAAVANKAAADASLHAAQVEKQNTELRVKFSNRRITAEQHAALVAILSKHPNTFNIEVMGDPESGMYAADILKTFTDAGWVVDKKEFPLGVIWTGLNVFQSDDPAAVEIAKALRDAGIPFSIGNEHRDKATIMVGGKPPVF
ncbi:hypothetical protein P0D73_30885 [Paraburkholderia sp. RL18-101-BIB-B]|uniref:hypothetical protein n=1 Tax=Paraburkholderia sp. RL18-101-BIB-B TaxID=3031634 RepID=UPI0038B80BE9